MSDLFCLSSVSRVTRSARDVAERAFDDARRQAPAARMIGEFSVRAVSAEMDRRLRSLASIAGIGTPKH